MTSVTSISVLISTRNRARDLEQTLPRLLANDYPDFEVIVVDQSDGSESEAVVRALQPEFPRLQYIHSDTKGSAKSRNVAMRAAKGELLAFVDDDCETPPDWVRTIVTLFAEDPEMDILFGQVITPSNLPPGVVVPCLYFDKRQQITGSRSLGMNANMALRRSVVDRIGYYDPALGPGGVLPGGEEFDFSYRARRAGLKVVADPRLVLTHRAFRMPDEWYRVMRSYGSGDAGFYLKHIRCGDGAALFALCRHLGTTVKRTVGEQVKNALRRPEERRRYSAVYIGALLRGMAVSMRYPIDRRQRLYDVH